MSTCRLQRDAPRPNERCPLIVVDGVSSPMTLRGVAGTPAQRTTVGGAADSKPSAFPVSVCESALPENARQVSVGTRQLPALAKAVAALKPDLVLHIGDYHDRENA